MKNIKKVTLLTLAHLSVCIIAFAITAFYGFYKQRYFPATIALAFTIFFINGFIVSYKTYTNYK